MIALMMAAMLQVPAACNASNPAAHPATGCPAWLEVYRNEGIAMFVDPASVRRSGDAFEIDERSVVQRPTAPDVMGNAVTRSRYDCRQRTVTILSLTAYNAAGTRLPEEQTVSGAIDPIVEGSIGAHILTTYCARPAGRQ